MAALTTDEALDLLTAAERFQADTVLAPLADLGGDRVVATAIRAAHQLALSSRDSDPEAAEAMLVRIVGMRSRDPVPLLQLASFQLSRAAFARARRTLSSTPIQGDPRIPALLAKIETAELRDRHQASVRAEREGDWKEAVRLLRSLVTSGDPMHRLRLADALAHQGRLSSAREELSRLTTGHSSVLLRAASLASRVEAPDLQEAFLRQAAETGETGATLALARVLIAGDRYDEGLALLTPLSKDPSGAAAVEALTQAAYAKRRQALLKEALRAEQAGEWGAAATALASVVSPTASGQLRLILFTARAGRVDQALRLIDAFVDAHPTEIGRAVAALQKIDDRFVVDRLIERFARVDVNGEAAMLLARLRFRQGRLAEALEAVRLCSPARDAEVCRDLEARIRHAGWVENWKYAQTAPGDESIASLERCLGWGVNLPQTKFRLAELNIAAGRDQDALQSLLGAWSNLEEDGEGHDQLAARLAALRWRLGDHDASFQMLQEAAKRWPRSELIRERSRAAAETLAAKAKASGVAAYGRGEYMPAKAQFERALGFRADPVFETYLDQIAIHDPGFEAALRADPAIQRIYLCGCGRSGTWLLTSLMSAFDDTAVLTSEEAPAGRFRRFHAPERTHVIKRTSDAYKTIASISAAIRLLYVVRDPFDVLVSHHRGVDRYITPERWIGETRALRAVLGSDRDVSLVRFEDLVLQTSEVEAYLSLRFGLTAKTPLKESDGQFRLPSDVQAAMHGARAMDPSAIGKHRLHEENLGYLKSLIPVLGEDLQWFVKRFGYEDSLANLDG